MEWLRQQMRIERVLAVVCVLAIGALYFYRLGAVPAGVFCDEAQFAVTAWKLIHWDTSDFINPFFYNHLGYFVSSLNVYSHLPFLAIFGLSEWSVRFSGAIYAMGFALLWWRSLIRMGFSHAHWAVLITLGSSAFFHLARFNIGHFVSLGLLSASWYFFVRFYFNSQPRRTDLVIASALASISMYGVLSCIVYAPVFLFLLSLLIVHRWRGEERRSYLMLVALTYLLMTLPFTYGALHYPEVMQRIFQKNSGEPAFGSIEKLWRMISNYWKYWDPRFLLLNGDWDLPGAFVRRITIQGLGIISKLAFVLLILGALPQPKDSQHPVLRRLFLMAMVLYPFPDLLTIRDNSSPYLFSLLCGLFWMPLGIALGLKRLLAWVTSPMKQLVMMVVIVLVFGFELTHAWGKYFVDYPKVSSDFWGWQYGPREIMAYFKAHESEYDEMWMSGYFNGPRPFLTLYDPDHKCRKCNISDIPEAFNLERRQLFAPRMEQWLQLDPKFKSKLVQIGEIRLPNGNPEFALVRTRLPSEIVATPSLGK